MSKYITTEQFMEEVTNLGFKVTLNNFYDCIEVVDKETDVTLASILSEDSMCLDTTYGHWNDCSDEIKIKLYDLLDRYARTPVSKRYTQKKYRLRLDIHRFVGASNSYFSKIKTGDAYLMTDGKETALVQAIFTQAEIDKMGDLTKGFVKEEVANE